MECKATASKKSFPSHDVPSRMTIEPYREEHIPAVQEFNHRLRANWGTGEALPFHFFESNIPEWLPRRQKVPIYQQYYLALDNGFVRGGFVTKHQDFSFSGNVRKIAFYHYPLSEGIINRKFAWVGGEMLKTALRDNPLLFALGIGGINLPLSRMLKAMRWSMTVVPFLFRINHPTRFLENLPEFRKTLLRRFLVEGASKTGLGWLGVKSLQVIPSLNAYWQPRARVEEVDFFSSWADSLWEGVAHRFAMVAVRDSNNLNVLYPSSNRRFIRIRVMQAETVVGWAVLLDTQMQNAKYFGNLRVGSIVDCLSVQGSERLVAQAATNLLNRRGVDLVVTNQCHQGWVKAFRQLAYFSGPSNFVFATSPQLTKLIHPFQESFSRIHLTRGDGDGPIRL